MTRSLAVALSVLAAGSFSAIAAAKPPPQVGGSSLTAVAAPTTVVFGRASTISGVVTGNMSVGAKVTLEQQPYPYTGPFRALATTTTLATPAGSYVFTGVRPGLHTHYRVVDHKAKATSPRVTVLVAKRVSMRVSTTRPRRGALVRFYGVVSPAHNGLVAAIQRPNGTGGWRTIKRTTLRAGTTSASSQYSVRVRINRTGNFRVRVVGDPDHLAGISAKRRLIVH